MGFWEKSVRIFTSLCEAGTPRVRHRAQHTGGSKRRAQRLTPAMGPRDSPPESWVWETAEGRGGLPRGGVAPLAPVGLQRGVGLDTLRACFSPRRLQPPGGSAPGARRGVMPALAQAIVELGHAWEQEATAGGEGPEVRGAVDAPCLARLWRVCLDLPTGSLLRDAAVDHRSDATWKARVDQRLAALGAPGRFLGSDRAQALIPRAEPGLGCRSLPEVVPRVPDIVQRAALALGRQWQQARQAWQKAPDGLQRPQAWAPRATASPDATRPLAATPANVPRWAAGHSADRQRRATLSLTRHSWRSDASAPQTSPQGDSGGDGQVAALAALAHPAQWPARPAARPQVKHHVPALAARGDCWWAGGRQALEPAAVSPRWRQWAPRVSGAAGVWGAPRASHAWRPAESQEAAGPGGCPRPLCPPGPHPGSSPAGPWGLGHLGHAAGAGLAACLRRRRRASWLSGAEASPAAGGAQAARPGVGRCAQLRWSRRRRHNSCDALFQAGISGPLGNSVSPQRCMASPSATKTRR
jgi:hypothetical protein